MTTKAQGESFWSKETFSGGMEYRTRTKVLLVILPFIFSALIYKSLILLEDTGSGASVILVLAYGAIVLMTTLMLLVIIVSIIEYLSRFE